MSGNTRSSIGAKHKITHRSDIFSKFGLIVEITYKISNILQHNRSNRIVIVRKIAAFKRKIGRDDISQRLSGITPSHPRQTLKPKTKPLNTLNQTFPNKILFHQLMLIQPIMQLDGKSKKFSRFIFGKFWVGLHLAHHPRKDGKLAQLGRTNEVFSSMRPRVSVPRCPEGILDEIEIRDCVSLRVFFQFQLVDQTFQFLNACDNGEIYLVKRSGPSFNLKSCCKNCLPRRVASFGQSLAEFKKFSGWISQRGHEFESKCLPKTRQGLPNRTHP